MPFVKFDEIKATIDFNFTAIDMGNHTQFFTTLIIFLAILISSDSVSASSAGFQAATDREQDYLMIKDDRFSGQKQVTFYLNNEKNQADVLEGMVRYPIDVDRKGQLFVYGNEENRNKQLVHVSVKSSGHRVIAIPLWTSIVPPLIAILLALLIKEVNLALFAGVWSGAIILGGLRVDNIFLFLLSLLETVSDYIIRALNNTGHLSVIVFSLMIGGMVAIISKNGGMAGVVKALSRYAKNRQSSQFVTWLLGIAIFFDDYANTLIVGNTMRPVTDKFRISREKLAYIVDSTAAPVSAIAFITTWIGAELGYIENGIMNLESFDQGLSAYSIFISSLKYSFYPVLALIFILILIRSQKDFGPMWKAEQRAINTGQVSPASTKSEDEPDMEDLEPVNNAPRVWWHAAVPVLTVILVTILGLVATGFQSSYTQLLEAGWTNTPENWGSIWSKLPLLSEGDDSLMMRIGLLIGNADSYIALLWASLSGLLMAIVITISNRIINVFDTMHHMMTGFKTMLPALLILTLAWALADITELLHTADFITGLLGEHVSAYFIPPILFVLAALIAFSTGSSWSTMAILYPLAIPAAWTLCLEQNIDASTSMEILFNSIATVLAASVLGDHCSPISDTTILSSLASDCNHIDHVRTQLPYALTVGLVSLICVTVSTILGGGWFVSFVLLGASIAALMMVMKLFGKKT
ncbi:MAG TPA: Na+/H+ antiporter NhaC family protein [Saprospiraceae bacterium]|nr:Na+/H+ antiporter NhaC family protein [Saprospiraceae bacterium]